MATATAKKTNKLPAKTQLQGGGDVPTRKKIPTDQFVEAVFTAEPRTINGISDKLGINPTAVSVRLKKLVEKGFLTEEDLPERQRGLTPQAEAELKEKIAQLRKEAAQRMKKAG